jgi:hypothetical protein
MQIAVVATACKLAGLCWHLVIKGEDYAFARPSLTDKKLRALELRAGMPSRRGQKGKAAVYSLKEVRRRERELAEQAEHAYRQLVADWQATAPKPKSGVAATNGTRLSRPSMGQAARQASVPDPALRSGSTTPARKRNPDQHPSANEVAARRGFRTPQTERSSPVERKLAPQEGICGPESTRRDRTITQKDRPIRTLQPLTLHP